MENPTDKKYGHVAAVVTVYSAREDEAAPGRLVGVVDDAIAFAFARNLEGRHSHSSSPWVVPAGRPFEMDKSDCDMTRGEIALDEALRKPFRRVLVLLGSPVDVSMEPKLIRPSHRLLLRWQVRVH
jgi:hypothetical protein